MKTKILFILYFIITAGSYSQVAQQWVTRYNGTANSADYGRSVAIDRFGNSYLCGSVIRQGRTQSDMILLKYNSAGDTVWSRVLSGPGDQPDVAADISVDTAGNIYLTGNQINISGNSDIVTCKFSPSGSQLWAKVYDAITGNDMASKISVDVSGNSFVSGRSQGTGTGYDVVSIKYNSSGDSVWVKRQNGTFNMDDNFGDHVIDAQGNFYLTCGLRITGGNMCFTTIKYNSGGLQQWLKIYSGPGGADNPNSIAIDSSGNIFVAGSSVAPATSYDIFMIKYNSNGDSLWNRRYPGISNLWEDCYDIGVNNSGDLYVTGGFWQYNGREAMGLIKYSSSGSLQWSKFWLGDDINVSTGHANSLALDPQGNIYFTGPFKDLNANQTDIYTRKYNSSGVLLFFEKYNGTGSSYDEPAKIVLNNQNEVFVGGSSFGSGSNYDLALIKYIQPPHYAPYSFTATAVSSSRINLVWSDINNNESGFKIERSTNGGVNWTLRDSVAADTLHYSDLGLTANTIYSYRIYAYSPQGQSVYSPVAFDTTFAPTGIVQTNEIPEVFKLYNNYPNPFNPSTTIIFDIPSAIGKENNYTSLIIYDLLGREVKTLINRQLQPGTYNVKFDGTNLASGMYLYKLVSGNFTDIKKMLMIK